MSPRNEAYLGVIRGHTGQSPGPASGITYRIVVNFPDGPREVVGISPAIQRWTITDVEAIANGTAVWVASVQGRLQLMERELPYTRPCPKGQP